MTNATVKIKKTAKADTGFGDHASYIGYPARYGIFRGEEQIGSILGEKRTYRNNAGDWTVYSYDNGITRETKRFFNTLTDTSPFESAKKWALEHFEGKENEQS